LLDDICVVVGRVLMYVGERRISSLM
jgi:hypothetical protein